MAGINKKTIGKGKWASMDGIKKGPEIPIAEATEEKSSSPFSHQLCEDLKISVIIPAYNAENYIEECLNSILEENKISMEVICVDDGSTDRTLSILREYEEKDDRLRVITQKNAGAGAARNNGLKFARGEYLAFLDADDFFDPGMLRLAYEQAHLDNSDIVVFRSSEFIDSTGEYREIDCGIREDLLPEKRPFAGSEIQKNIFEAFIGWPWDKLFRAEFIRETQLRFQEQRTTNDALFVFMAIVKAERISTMDEVLAYHRRLGDGQSLSVSREKSWDCFYKALIAMKEQLIAWDLFERYEQDFVNYALHFSLWNVNTIKGNAYKLLYLKLKEEWFQNLGILGQDDHFFYNKAEINNLKTIFQMDAEEYVFYRLDWALNHIQYQERQLNMLNQERDQLKQHLAEAEKRLRQEQESRKELQQSKSYQMGRVITWPYRELKDKVKKSPKREP